MFQPGFLNAADPMGFGLGMPGRRFDEYYRCYPVAMLPGPERENVNHGGKVIMPPSALDKLTRLHITYPMLFELINGAADRMSHAGVLEFIADEGKIYLPFWMLQTLQLEPGDLIQIKSTDLPPGNFIKLQPQSPAFLDISDPKAVLENAFRNFSCMSVGDVFTFAYNDSVYEIAVLETKPSLAAQGAISVLETDIEVDFAAPIGYVEPAQVPTQSGSAGLVRPQGSMAEAINYASIAPAAAHANPGVSSHFLTTGQKLKSSAKLSTTTPENVALSRQRQIGPQPLRLPAGKLFFGFEVKPVRTEKDKENGEVSASQPRFQGQGQTLRKGNKRKEPDANAAPAAPGPSIVGTGAQGRTLKDKPRS